MIVKSHAFKYKNAIFSLVGWIGIILIIVLIYSFRHELLDNRVIASLAPGHGYSDSTHSLNFMKASNGHFYITAKINNTSIKFLVDTGASDTVISQNDAKKLGLNVETLPYTKTYHTANGDAKAAPITIKSIKIGQFIINDISAAVNKEAMQDSLLGMSALSEFSIKISNDTLTLG